MKTRKNTLIISIVTILVISAVLFTFNFNSKVLAQEDIKKGAQEGMKAFDFTLNNLAGDEISLSNFKGQPIFLNFWASWCPPCKEEMPALQKLYENDENVKILTVNVQENKDKVLNYLMENKYSFTTLLDKNGSVASKYLVRGIPTTFVIDKDGIIIKKHTGGLTYQQMLDLINN